MNLRKNKSPFNLMNLSFFKVLITDLDRVNSMGDMH